MQTTPTRTLSSIAPRMILRFQFEAIALTRRAWIVCEGLWRCETHRTYYNKDIRTQIYPCYKGNPMRLSKLVITTQSKRPRSLLPTSPSFQEEIRGAGNASHAPTLGGSVGLRRCKGCVCATLSKPPRSFLPSPPSPRGIRGAGDASHTPTLGGRDMHVKGIYL